MNNKKAFTLTELIIALGIIGTIAALTVPSILKNINKKILSSQIKNTVASIQQLVTDQMVTKKTKILADTDFASPESLLSSANFEISGICPKADTEDDNAVNCWADTYKVFYVQNNRTASQNITTDGTVPNTITAIKLKNGTTIGYSLASESDVPSNGEDAYGKFYVDLNGTEEPNIVGRDFFEFYLTEKGKLVATEVSGTCHDPISSNLDAALNCFSILMNNNWKMPDNDADY